MFTRSWCTRHVLLCVGRQEGLSSPLRDRILLRVVQKLEQLSQNLGYVTEGAGTIPVVGRQGSLAQWPEHSFAKRKVGGSNRGGLSTVDIEYNINIMAYMPEKRGPGRKDYLRNYNRRWMRARRLAFFGGKCCVMCGSSDNLELDHIDPETKITHRIWSWAEDKRLAEIAKCQILCKPCHRIKTASQREAPRHGTSNMYSKHKCRCDLCKEYKSKENALRYK